MIGQDTRKISTFLYRELETEGVFKDETIKVSSLLKSHVLLSNLTTANLRSFVFDMYKKNVYVL